MKIDKTKLKKNNSEAPGDCGWLIEKLHTCSDEELLPVLRSIETWSYGKCELHHWVNVLDRFDSILEIATKREENKWVLPCDLLENSQMQELVVWVLYFTTLLVEHSFSRHLYSSVEHLITLLSSSSMTVILSVLNLLYMFSKRSNFITRLVATPRQALLSRLIHLAESWGGKENGFGLAQCCQNLPLSSYPDGATTLHFEYYFDNQKVSEITGSPVALKPSSCNSSTITIHINNIQSISKSPGEIMEELLEFYNVPVEKQMLLFTHLRLAHSFAKYETRLQCVQARLQAISILVYCNSLQDNAYTVLYSGLLDEFVDVLELKDTNLTEIKAATLRTLTSIIHLERLPNFPKLSTIIDVTGASSYHGFLPVLVRSCISTLTSISMIEPNPFPAPLATALFSFLYHLASYEAGGEALVSCGMMESLLSVVTWVGTEPDHITFVTRAVRVIDLITNLDMNAFQTHGGLNTFIKRLELEVNECRKEQPFIIQLPAPLGTEPGAAAGSRTEGTDTEMPGSDGESRDNSLSPMDITEEVPQNPPSIESNNINEGASTSEECTAHKLPDYSLAKTNQTCLPQRAALLKSMLNFLKKDIQDPGFSESMRHLMESSLPSSLKHIISNAEYYGPSLFLLATDVVTVYVFGEPSLLSSLQDNGLTDVVLHALLVKDVPATREVLASLPNVFSALCLNTRGLQAFAACKPFERLFKVLLSPDYLPAMRRRRSSDPMGDTASNLGNAMDELMRHQPSLKPQAMVAIVKLLEEVCLLGSDAHYVCWKTPPKNEPVHLPTSRNPNDNSSDEEDEEEEERDAGGGSSSTPIGSQDVPIDEAPSGDKRPVPLVDYILNVMKFVDAILSNNSTDDHCKEFVAQKGLLPLLGILGLPNLPIDFHSSLACQSVASVCKSILNLAHESGVLQQGLQCLHDKLEALSPLHDPLPAPGGSVLLRELAMASNPSEATNSPQSTPLLHTLGAIHAYIMMLVHVCRTGQPNIRQLSIKQWGTELGLKVLAGLTKLYTSLVWESTVLLALCSDDVLPAGCLFAKEDTIKLLPPDLRTDESPQNEIPMEISDADSIQLPLEGAGIITSSGEGSGITTSLEALNKTSNHQMKLIKPLLSSASRLGKTLAELFGLLVKLCVGSPIRQRRGQQVTPPLAPPSAAAVAVASALSHVLHAGLSWTPPPSSPLPKFRLTFLICSVRFTNPMLFDEKKMPYHLMLQHFVKSHGLKAFFDIFNWTVHNGEEGNRTDFMEVSREKELPDGTGEFLDTWLFLLEKLVNPKTMLESPHSLPTKSSFCPLKFLIKIHKLAFEAVMKLWNKKPLKNYGVKISESVLVILCSILRGESIIAEKIAKDKANAATPTNQPETNVTPAPTMGGSAPVEATASNQEGIVDAVSEFNPVTVAMRSDPGSSSNIACVTIFDPDMSFPQVVDAAVTPTAETFEATNVDSTSTSVVNSEPIPISVLTGETTSTSALNLNTNSTTMPSTTAIATSLTASATDSLEPPVTSVASTDNVPSGSTEARPLLVPYSIDSPPNPTPSTEAPVTANLPQQPQSLEQGHPYLQALFDMGFPQERCLDAISHTHTLEQATEYLLTNPMGTQGEGDMDYSEEDQWLQAVAMSLRENLQPISGKPPIGDTSLAVSLDVDEDPLSKEKLDEFTTNVLNGCLDQLDIQPQLVYKVCELLTTCVARNGPKWRENMLSTLMSQISEEATELILITSQGSTPDTAEYVCASSTALKFGIRLHLVTLLFEEMKSGCAGALEEVNLVDLLVELLCSAQDVMSSNSQVLLTLSVSQAAAAASKEDKKVAKDKTKDKELGDGPYTPKWLSPAMLLLDLYEKLSVATCRKVAVKKVTNHVWKWFDVSAIKWYSYTQSNNKTIDDAYWAGESSVKVINGRKKYTIQFHNMLQINDETGNRRPIMIGISEKVIAEHKNRISAADPATETSTAENENPESEKATQEKSAVAEMEDTKEDPEKPLELTKPKPLEEEKMEIEAAKPDVTNEATAKTETLQDEEDLTQKDSPKHIQGFNDEQRERLIRACVGYMKLGVEPDTLHALMRLCLRITRLWHNACLFASLGGIRTLLTLNESSAFWGFQNLAALLMRHILEEPNTLRHTMKKVVRYSAGSTAGMGAKELHSLLRLLAPAASRDHLLFTEIAQQCLRIDLNMALKRNLMTTSNEESILMKSIGSKSVTAPSTTPLNQNYSQLTSDSSEPQQLIHDLLESLATTDEGEITTTAVSICTTNANTPVEERTSAFSAVIPGNRHLQLSRSSSANDMVVQDMDEQSPMESDTSKVPGLDTKLPVDDPTPKKKKTLLSKSTICKLLAEYVRSYAGVAKLITDHQYSAGINDKITEDCSALAYLLDHLVCSSSEQEMVNHVRVLIAALASCNHAPDAQATLVSEVKCCLSRVMCLPESPEKHTKIQALVGLTGTMMESCPSQLNQPVNNCFKQQQLGMNNMIRIMIKKNLVTDLARIPHCLDLSSPNMATTINAALKPLETVLRIVNLPSFVPVQLSKKKSTSAHEQQQPSGTGTTNSEATRAQGEDNAEDAENTEHDISGAGESLEPNSEANPNEDGTMVESDEAGLNEILNQLLDDRRPGSRTNRSTPLRDNVTATVTYVIDHDPPMDTDDTLHDSRMVSHSESQFLDENEDGGNDDNDETSASSEDNDGDDNEEEVEEDDDDDDDDGDDDDDDDDDDEDEEEGSVFDEGYEDLEEAFIRLPGERESDDILLLPSYQQYIDTIDTIIYGDRIPLPHHGTTQDESVFMTSTPNANSNATNSIPNHPLFQNPREVAAPSTTRLANTRPSRQRGVLRLLGQTHRDVLQLTSNLREATQLFITNPDVRLLPPDHEDFIDSTEAGGSFMNTTRSGSSLNLPSVPNALTRWMEEARVLESDSLHDAVTQVKPALMAVLEKHRDIEQADRDKKKKEQEAAKPSSDTKPVDAVSKPVTEGESLISTPMTATSSVITAAGIAPPPSSSGSGSATNLIISILEQHFSSSGSLTSGSTAPPTFSGLLTQLAPSSSSGTIVSIQESPLSTVPEIGVGSVSTTALENLPVADVPTPVTQESLLGTSTESSSVAAILSSVTSSNSLSSLPNNLTSSSLQILTPSSYTPSFLVPAPTYLNSTATLSQTFPSSDFNSVFSDSDMTSTYASIPSQLLPTAGIPSFSTANDDAMSFSPTVFSQGISDSDNSNSTPPIMIRESSQIITPLSEPQSTIMLTDSSPLEAVILENSSTSELPENPVTIPDVPVDLQNSENGTGEIITGTIEATSSLPILNPQPVLRLLSGRTTTDPLTDRVTSGPTSTSVTLQQSDYSAILGDLEIPEGVDPSFLAALPEEMRQEVIAEQLRIQRVRERAEEAREESSSQTVGEVNPEFLAALPPNIQEEVLAQQRIEQQRQQAARANPDDPVSFLQTLPQSLRQSILSDLEESQFSALPPDVAQEAQNLRRQREDRNRHVHEHMLSRSGPSISHILRNTARLSSRFLHSPSWSSWNVRPTTSGQANSTSAKCRGQQLLDHEAMTCLLVLLFVDEPKLNTARLHRVLKSLCHHPPTREWVVKTLLSIIERCGDLGTLNGRGLGDSEAGISGLSLEMSNKKAEKSTSGPSLTSTPAHSQNWKSESRLPQTPSWLSMSMDAALGCRANIFQIQRFNTGGKRTGPSAGTFVHIHPQAAPLVCRHSIDLLISLAKTFPSHFLPTPKESEEKGESKKVISQSGTPNTGAVPKGSKSTTLCSNAPSNSSILEATDFWELLTKLDSISVSKKGKGLPRTHAASTSTSDQELKITSLESSPIGQLIQQLAHPVIKRSSLLTDRLLRLLALVSLGHPDTADSSSKQSPASLEGTKALEHLLSLSIEVLTSKSCSEEGLEDATALLLHLSHGPPPARDLVLKLLLQGATTLGNTVTIHIRNLLVELRDYNAAHPQVLHEEDIPLQSEKSKKGVLKDRFTSEQVVIQTSNKVKPPCEVQLPSMSALTSKTSSQAFFLRTLKVIIQLRDAIRLAKNRKNKNTGNVTRDILSNVNMDNLDANQQEQLLQEIFQPREQVSSSPQEPVNNESYQPMEQTPPASQQEPLLYSTETVSSQSNNVEASSSQQMDISPVVTLETIVPTVTINPSEPVSADPAGTVTTINPSETESLVEATAIPEAMEVDQETADDDADDLRSLSSELGLEELWATLSQCLVELGETPDPHAVLVLQPAVEAFFLVHASAVTPDKKAKPNAPLESREAQLSHLQHDIAPLSPLPASQMNEDGSGNQSTDRQSSNEPCYTVSDAEKFLSFAETHRSVLNQILRQSTVHLADGPFSVLVDHTRLLDFDIKRKYFRTELERADDGMRREDLAVHVRREHVFEDSFRELHRRTPEEWKNRFYIVFEGEEGQDAGGLLREWYVISSREIFNPMYALFCTSPGDRVTYMINPSSHCNSNHLSYFKFVGRVIAKAIYDNKLLECYFTRSFYKHILGKMVRVADMESEDYSFYQGLIFLMDNNVSDLGYELTFSTEVQEFGVTEARDLKPNGRNIIVTGETKMEYIRLVCQEKMTGAIKKQLNSFLEGFYDIIPKRLISIFNEQELELLISGLPTIDIDDLKNNSEYHKYNPNSLQIQWFWRALRSFDQAERAKLVQFVTGTSKVPLQGFSALEGMNGVQKFQIHRDDRSTDRLPSAHTCFNQLDLPVYETYDKLRHYLLKAIQECSEGFGFA